MANAEKRSPGGGFGHGAFRARAERLRRRHDPRSGRPGRARKRRADERAVALLSDRQSSAGNRSRPARRGRPGRRLSRREATARTGRSSLRAAELTGVLLVGLTLAERAWGTLGEICVHRLAVGKLADGLELPFPILDDGQSERAAIIGLVAGLNAAP